MRLPVAAIGIQTDRGADPTHVHGKQGGTRLPACVPFRRGRPGARQAGTRACAADAPRLRESGQRHCGDRRGNGPRFGTDRHGRITWPTRNKDIPTLPMTYCRRWSSNDRRDDDSSAGAAPRLRGPGGTGIGEARLDRGGLHPRPRRAFHSVPQSKPQRPPDRHRPGHRGARARHETHGNGRPCRPFHARARGIRRLLPSAFRPRRRQGQRGVHGPRIVQPADR